jgi:replicative DNA helicase
MTENTENTLSAYLGPQFQLRLMWQLLVEPEFAEKILPNLAIEYFDDPNLKRLFMVILEYYKEYDKVPNLQNQSIHQAINKYKSPNNLIEEESLNGVIKRVSLWNERVINKQMLYDGDVIQKSTNSFIKQQEYRKTAEDIIKKVKSGEIKDKNVISIIEDRFRKISHIGEESDDSESLTEGITKALRKEFRETIPTGIETIDALTGNGLGKGEIGVILTPSGVGKTTALTIIANTAYEQEKNVAQIIFEDTKDQIKRKHYTIWAKSALSKLNDDDENERVAKVVSEKVKTLEGKGRLIIKRFSQEDTTMKDIRNWMISYEKKWGFKFDILVLDYLDCVESHKRSVDRNENELTVIKGFEALSSDFDIPCWTAIQSNRSGFGAEYVEVHQSGGSIKRIQKAHFFMSVAKTPAQQEANFANIRILKARFAKDGQTFEDCVFNNDTMEIRITDPRYPIKHTLKKHGDEDINKIENKASKLSATSKMHVALNQHEEGILIDKLKNDDINNLLRDNAAPEELEPNKEFHPEAEHHEKEILADRETEEIINLDNKTTEVDLNQDNSNQIPEIIDKNVSEETLTLNGDVTDKLNDVDNNIINGTEDVPIDNKDDDLLEWSGETFTVNSIKNEIKLNDIGVNVESNVIKFNEENKNNHNNSPPEKNKNQINNINEILLTDPDEYQGQNRNVYNILVKKRSSQQVIKKE